MTRIVQESEIIPYTPSQIPPGPWLIFAPHPDDEALGMGGTIVLGEKTGIEIHLVILTDGGKGGDVQVRKNECLEASRLLGIKTTSFLNLPDRKIFYYSHFKDKIIQIIRHCNPETIFLPHPQEYHPDHRATCGILQSILQTIPFKGGVWLYDITRAGETNKLIDISSALEIKAKAINCYKSQLQQNDYKEIALSLNRARSLTLPDNISHAESFWSVTDISNLYQEVGSKFDLYFGSKHFIDPLVSIIVRTHNRPKLLLEALHSILRQDFYGIEAVIVCDGGEDMEHVIASLPNSRIAKKYIRNEFSKGRAAAANSGVMAASGRWIMFLDDDDIFETDCIQKHFEVVKKTGASVAYGQVLREHYHDHGAKNDQQRDYLYSRQFDKNLLYIQNYIPFISIFLHRDVFSNVGYFDESLPVNEDWDFLIRLARKYDFTFHENLVARYRCFGSATAVDGRKDIITAHQTEAIIRKKWWSHISTQAIDSFRRYVEEETSKHFIEENNSLLIQRNELQNKINKLVDDYQQSKKLLHENEYLKKQLSAIDNSRSWRITAPLRKTTSIIKKGIASIKDFAQKKNSK